MESYNVELLPTAYSDLDELLDYILAERPQAAEMILDKIMQSLRHLESFLQSGAPVLERSLKKFSFRMTIVDPYIVFYRFIDQKVIVYRILHGTRYYSTLLKDTIHTSI